MDQSVALVEAYLQANGYFVVAEYPVLHHDENWYVATDLDILAVRFPRQNLADRHRRGLLTDVLDPSLGVPDGMDMIIGEVKEGRASLNPAIRAPRVVATALERFGCCDPDELNSVVDQLAERGYAKTAKGHQIRVVCFASQGDTARAERVVALGHMVRFLKAQLSQHWYVYRHAQLNGNSALGFLQLLEKAERGVK